RAGRRPALLGAFGSRIELRLVDPPFSILDRRGAAGVPAAPGRGLSPGRQHMLVYQPRLGGTVGEEGLDDAASSAAAHLATRWRARVRETGAAPVRLLPQ